MFGSSLNNPAGERVGQIIALGAGTIQLPYGYLACDGSAISRTLYKRLFDVIGTSYGSGDGTTTFNLPTQSAIVNSVSNLLIPSQDTGNEAFKLWNGKSSCIITAYANGTGHYDLQLMRTTASNGTVGDNPGSHGTVPDAQTLGFYRGLNITADIDTGNYLFCIRY